MPYALPEGIHDVLPNEARERRRLGNVIMDRLMSSGYEPVVLPAFELSSVTDAALGTMAQSDVLRFVEPSSGEIASLRPDMTPQVARLVATRLTAKPGPYRIACEGVVIRRRAGRARKHRQIAQIGAELIGVAGEDADFEQTALACEALRAAGLGSFVLELSHAGIARALLEGAPQAQASKVTEALATKDTARVDAAARGLPHARELSALTRTFGGEDALLRAEELLRDTPAKAQLAELRRLYDRTARGNVAAKVACDPGEVRHYAYYTGSRFTIFADGLGEPIGGGGRYDGLLANFGAPMPATGFGLNLDHIAFCLARHEAGPIARLIT